MNNVKISLDEPMLNLSGEPFSTGETKGKVLANQLATSSEGDPIKYYDWATALWAGEPISVDQSDLSKLIEFVKASPNLVVLSRAQLLKALEKYKK